MKKAERDRRVAAAEKRHEAELERHSKFAARARDAAAKADQAKADIAWLNNAPIEDEPSQPSLESVDE